MTFCSKCAGTVPRPGEVFDWPKPCACPPDPRNDPSLLPVRRTDRIGERKFIPIARLDALEAVAAADVALEAAVAAVEVARIVRLEALDVLRRTP